MRAAAPTPSPTPGCSARQLTDEQRSSIAAYFAVYRGQERGVARLALGAAGEATDHPAILRAHSILQEAFEQV